MTDEVELKKRERGNGEFEEQQYYAMGFNKYDLSDPLYDSKWKKLLRDEFWDKALPVTFVPEVPKPAGPPYMMYTYQSSAKGGQRPDSGKEFLNTIPFFFPTKADTRSSIGTFPERLR